MEKSVEAPKRQALDELLPLIVELAGKPEKPIDSHTHFTTDLAMDSLTLVDLIASVERKFALQMTDAEVIGIETVGDLTDIISVKAASHDGDR
jgi:acyl carrier protein